MSGALKLRPRPRRETLLHDMDTAVTRLDDMIGRYGNGIPVVVRAELTLIRAPLERDLIVAGLRGDGDRMHAPPIRAGLRGKARS